MTRVLAAQSGGCTAIINNSLVSVVAEAQATGVEEIYGARFGVRGLLGGDFVDLGRQDRAVLEGVRRTPTAILSSERYKLGADDCIPALRRLS